jgi:hypothetical protein
MSKFVFQVMDHTGHSMVEFDKSDAKQMDQAKALFDKLVSDHSRVAQRKTGETDYVVSKSFDPEQDEALVVRPMQGG